MNAEQYWREGGRNERDSKFFYRLVRNKLKRWQQQQNIEERCIVHHRDDTEECRRYNSEHYELWGHAPDGTFEYGKYVIFVTQSEHSAYHASNPSDETREKMRSSHTGKTHSNTTKKKLSESRKGEKNPLYGKRGKDSPNFGKTHSDVAKRKMSEKAKVVNQAHKLLYTVYKSNGGSLGWNGFRHALASGEITFEQQPITVFTK